jgi:predicted amidophosphoribosyltransferase
MFGFGKKNNDVLIIAGICECCDKKIYNTEKYLKCCGFTCTFHKKCFKQVMKDANNFAIVKGYKAKFTKKNMPCKCGNGF